MNDDTVTAGSVTSCIARNTGAAAAASHLSHVRFRRNRFRPLPVSIPELKLGFSDFKCNKTRQHLCFGLQLTPKTPKVYTNCTALSLMPTIIGNTFAASLRTDICPQRKDARPRLTLGIRLILTF
jgi:hypothetical protein